MKSQLIDGKMTLEEVHRFKNGFRKVDGHERWDIQALIKELLTGLEKVKKSGIKECFLGIDTWAVDYCLVDKNGDCLADPIAYRDSRTDQAINEFQKKMSLETDRKSKRLNSSHVSISYAVFCLKKKIKYIIEYASN